MRFFLVDRVTELVVGERVRGVKAVTLTDEILHDHFPDYPVMPGTLVVESVAQLAGFLLELTSHRELGSEAGPPLRAVLSQIRGAKFYEPAVPGDVLDLEVKLGARLEGAAQLSGEARVAGKRVARVDLTFVLRRVDSEHVHEQRRSLYRLWTRGLPGATPNP